MWRCCRTDLADDENGEARLLRQKRDDCALDPSAPVDILALRNSGYLLQYFAVGLIFGGLPATQYGLFVAYLNVPAYVSTAASTLSTFPWSIKILFALLSDGVPLFGYRRRPWMMVGWTICTLFLICLACTPLPTPYFCFTESGKLDLHKVCNSGAAHEGLAFALLMMCAACGYVLADVAADGLTVSYARREAQATRGKTQTTAYLVRTMGQICAQLLVGLGMNGPEYEGTFSRGISFSTVCAILAIPSFAMLFVSWFLIEEPRVVIAAPGAKLAKPSADLEEAPSLGHFLASGWKLFESAALLDVVLFQFLSNAIGSIGTTAGPEVQRVWAGVQNLQNQLFSIAGNVLFIFGLWLVRQRFLNFSWRLMLIITTVLVNVIDIPITFITIYDVLRNQYFYLDDGLITAIPSAASFIVGTYVIVELAQPGTEALTYGILTTASNLGGPVASGLSNWFFGYWHPSLSDSANYVEDEPEFRTTVALSFVIGYAFSFLSLAVLPLLPDQKADTHARLATRPRHWGYACATFVILFVGFLYSLTVDLLSVIPSTSCLEIAGGTGCNA
ncbi:hypothetical protein AB1Y20_017602 [Prymnesium parvum]|uniref:Folate-Biopterin Transporter (FBT) Family n=1 Tax=Prymnesium parvum TaxID=97485 RepID=A0AB34JM83_PRYPA|mmetsp:Transcript_11236/g.23783  ORF Transcript_11236/g.23783 Transcript_11236/m.23783 type:complete len:561 (-) Transcript_11236:164-1846(-)